MTSRWQLGSDWRSVVKAGADGSASLGEKGGKAILGLSRLGCPSAKPGKAVNSGAVSAVYLDR